MSSNSEGLITNSYHLDSQYFTGNMYNPALLEQRPNEIYAIQSQFVADAYTEFKIGNVAIKANKYKLTLSNNIYAANFAGSRKSVIQINGFTIVNSFNETYENNENWFKGAQDLYSAFTLMKPEQKQTKYSTSMLQSYEHKSQSMLTIYRALWVQIKGTKFDNNYVVDDTDPYEHDPWYLYNQSHSFLLVDFIGELHINGGTEFKNNRGLQTGNFVKQYLEKGYLDLGFKNRLIQFNRFKFQKFIFDDVKFIGNEAMNYTDDNPDLQKLQGKSLQNKLDASSKALQTMRPRLFNISIDDFADLQNFQWNEGMEIQTNEALILNKVEISHNTFKYSDCLINMPLFNLTYSNWIIDGNGKPLAKTSKFQADAKDYETTKAIVVFDLTDNHLIRIDKMRVVNNIMQKGSVIVFREVESKMSHNPHAILNVFIYNSSFFGNNTSIEGPTSSIFIEGKTPWLWMRILHSKMMNNFGVLTNELYGEWLKRFEFFESNWGQETLATNPKMQARSKFLLIDKHFYEVNVTNSNFNCDIDYDQQTILSMNSKEELLQPSLVKINVTADNSFYSNMDISQDLVILDTDVEFTAALVCFNLTDMEFVTEQQMLNKSNIFYKCEYTMFTNQFKNNRFRNCNQAVKGAILHISNGAQVNVTGEHTLASVNSALEGGFAYVDGIDSTIFINNEVQIDQQRAYFGADVFAINQAIVNFTDVNVAQGEVYEGHVFLQTRCKLYMLNGYFKNNIAHDKGMISAHSASIIEITRTEFHDNEAMYDALILFLEGADQDRILQDGQTYEFVNMQRKISTLLEVKIFKNKLNHGGNVIKAVNSNLEIINSRFIGNTLLYMHGGIHIMYGNLYIRKTEFEMTNDNDYLYNVNNQAVDGSIQGGHVYIGTNSTFHSDDNKYTNSRTNLGGCVVIQGQTKVFFKNDIFRGCTAEYGGAIYGVDFGSLTIRNCQFMKNAVFGGKGQNIYLERFNGTFTIEDSSLESFLSSIYINDGYDLVTNNVVMTFGSDQLIYPEDLYKFIKPKKVVNKELVAINKEMDKFGGIDKVGRKICNATDTTSLCDLLRKRQIILDREDASPLKIIEDIQSQTYQYYAGGFYILNMQKISNFTNVDMKNLRATNGGGIHVEISQNFREMNDIYNVEPYVFSNLVLSKCKAKKNGGGFYIRNIKRMQIIGNETQTQITSNFAADSGGGIMFLCDKTDIYHCELSIGRIRISENRAQKNGGGIFWPQVKPKFQNISTSLRNNTAGYYGNEQASFPTQIVKIIDQLDPNKINEAYPGKSKREVFTRYVTQNGDNAFPPIEEKQIEYYTPKRYLIPSVQSGGYIEVQYLALIDENRQVCSNNLGSQIRTSISNVNTTIYGQQIFFSMYGTFNISGMEIETTPGLKDISMVAEADQQAIDTHTRDKYTILFDLEVRPCMRGEAQLEKGNNFICKKCTSNEYSLVVPQPRVPLECEVCRRDVSECMGGFQIGPRRGYWRQNDTTVNFLKCKNPAACTGTVLTIDGKRDIKTYNATGNCALGYYGAMCAGCIPGYFKTGEDCRECPDSSMDILRIIGMTFCAGGFVIMLVKGTMVSKTGKQSKNTHSVFIKIFMNHMQMVFITTSFKMNWPQFVTDLLQRFAFITQLQEAILRYDCLLETQKWPEPEYWEKIKVFEDPGSPLRLTYYKLMITAMLPIIMGIISISSWTCILYYYRDKEGGEYGFKKTLYNKFISTLVILLFLVHPTITQSMFDMFNCKEYDGYNRMEKDLQIVCYEGPHYYFAYFLALPCIFLWSLGIPFLIYTLLSKEKEQLKTEACLTKFGFLYTGYKPNRFTWEIFIMYRKIICLVIAIFLSRAGIIVQALILILFMIFFTGLNATLRPYNERALNEIEDVSLYTQIVTIYCGLFFISNIPDTDPSYDPTSSFSMSEDTEAVLFSVIIVSNVVFIVMWVVSFVIAMKSKIKDGWPRTYLYCFLCGRKDKEPVDDEIIANNAKRETIIEKIEDIEFFIGHMKSLYSKQIAYEGHEKFIQLLYYIQNERKSIDLTVKRHNLYIQGEIARERKFDKERIREQKLMADLPIEDEFQVKSEVEMKESGGFPLKSGAKESLCKGESSNPKPSSDRKGESNMFGMDRTDELGTQDEYEQFLTKPDKDQKSGAVNIEFEDSAATKPKEKHAIFDSSMQVNQLAGSLTEKKLNVRTLTTALNQGNKAFDSDDDGDDKKAKGKKNADGNIEDAISKSRNFNKLALPKKQRVFAEDLDLKQPAFDQLAAQEKGDPGRGAEQSKTAKKDHPKELSGVVRKYMLNFFPRPDTPKRDEEDEDSPVKGNANKAENEKVAPEDPGHHDDSSQPQADPVTIDIAQLGGTKGSLDPENLETSQLLTPKKKVDKRDSKMSGQFGERSSRSGKKKERRDSAVLSEKSEKDSQATGRLGPRESSAAVLSSRQASGVQETTEKTDQVEEDSAGQDATKIDVQQIEFKRPSLPRSKRKRKEKESEDEHKEAMKKDLIRMLEKEGGIRIKEDLLYKDDDGEKQKENRQKQYEEYAKVVEYLTAKEKKPSSTRDKSSKDVYPDKTWAVRGYQHDDVEEDTQDQAIIEATPKTFYWYYSIEYSHSLAAHFPDISKETTNCNWIAFKESEDATEEVQGEKLVEMAGIGPAPFEEFEKLDWRNVYEGSINLRWQGQWIRVQPSGPQAGLNITKEYMKKMQSRMRPQTNIGFKMIVDQKDEQIKIVPVVKPVIKKKVKFGRDEVSGAETQESISDDNDKLNISLVENDNMEKVFSGTQYRSNKHDNVPFWGEHKDEPKSKQRKRERIKEENRNIKKEKRVESQNSEAAAREGANTSKTQTQAFNPIIGQSDHNNSVMIAQLESQNAFSISRKLSRSGIRASENQQIMAEEPRMRTIQNQQANNFFVLEENTTQQDQLSVEKPKSPFAILKEKQTN